MTPYARLSAHQGLLAAACAVLSLCACHPSPPAADTTGSVTDTQPADAGESKQAGVNLTQEQINTLGIATQALEAVDYTPRITGYGVVLAHEPIAAAVAELTTATLSEKQTRMALTRAHSLSGTPGALSVEQEDSATRQAAADSAARTLAAQRLSGLIGSNPAWKSVNDTALLQALAGGKVKLLRATFPLAAFHEPAPPSLRAAHLDALQSDLPHAAGSTPGAGMGTTATPVWEAPADPTVSGRSFFALLRSSEFSEGERVLVWAPGAGPAQRGVLLPATAIVLSNGKSWCYLEKRAGRYDRLPVDTDRPLESGYVVTQGLAVGDKVVTSSAGLLLAHETTHSDDGAD